MKDGRQRRAIQKVERRDGGAGERVARKQQSRGKRRKKGGQKGREVPKIVKRHVVHPFARCSMEYGEKVHGKIQREVRHFLRDRAQNEEREKWRRETFNEEAKRGEGYRNATDAARTTEGTKNEEDEKHTSGGVFVAIDKHLGAVHRQEEGVQSTLGKRRKNGASLDYRQRMSSGFCGVLLALGRMDRER